jgi:basic amino acid/polyamine antiporter, APA family
VDSGLFRVKNIDQLISDSQEPEHRLKKSLGWLSLTSLGIGAVIGSGIFTVVGTAIAGQKLEASSILNAPLLEYLIYHSPSFGRPGAGPAIAISFMLVAVVCGFAALCYAELAAMIPIAGSAYTYTYATMGELIAWIIGWDLILEYAVSNMAVSVGFSAHVVGLLDWFGIHPNPRWISPAYLPSGLTDFSGNEILAPGWHFGFNWPAFLIVMVLTVILVRGIRESAETNNVMVLLKIIAIIVFVGFGARLIHPSNWHPYAPNGWPGILTGGSIIFFTYIGFDSVSTAAEESRNPQKDLPFGIIMSLIVCTVLYVGVAIVLLGMMKYTTFVSGEAAEAPVAYAMKYLGVHPFFRSVIVIGALTGMISSLLVFQYGQARIWYAMSRDGLLPKLFSAVHPKYKTPHWSTWIACFAVGIPAGLVDIGDAADLANIGTLFAFVLVSLGVILLRRNQPDRKRAFRVPFVPWFPLISVALCGGLMLGLTLITWLRFVIWLALGLVIYIFYSRHHSEFKKTIG